MLMTVKQLTLCIYFGENMHIKNSSMFISTNTQFRIPLEYGYQLDN